MAKVELFPIFINNKELCNYTIDELKKLVMFDLKSECKRAGIYIGTSKKDELIQKIVEHSMWLNIFDFFIIFIY